MVHFDCNSFADVALELLTGPGRGSPAYVRTAANRIYYSQYGYLRRRITTEQGDCFVGGGGKPMGKHRPLYMSCIRSNTPKIRRIGKKLEKLCLLRERGDYTWTQADEPTPTEVETAHEEAERLRKKIDKLEAQDLREIYDAVLHY